MDEPIETLVERAVDQLIDTEANIQWLDEFPSVADVLCWRLPNKSYLMLYLNQEVERLDHGFLID